MGGRAIDAAPSRMHGHKGGHTVGRRNRGSGRAPSKDPVATWTDFDAPERLDSARLESAIRFDVAGAVEFGARLGSEQIWCMWRQRAARNLVVICLGMHQKTSLPKRARNPDASYSAQPAPRKSTGASGSARPAPRKNTGASGSARPAPQKSACPLSEGRAAWERRPTRRPASL